MRFWWLQSIRQSMHSQRRAAVLLLVVFFAVPTAYANANANANCKGTYYFANGDRCEGDIQNGALKGKARFTLTTALDLKACLKTV